MPQDGLVESILRDLIALPKKAWGFDSRRYVHGENPSQKIARKDIPRVLVFGLAKSKVSTHLYVSSGTSKHPTLCRNLVTLAAHFAPLNFKFSSIHVLDSFVTAEHVDANNASLAATACLGSFSGGSLGTRVSGTDIEVPTKESQKSPH